MRQIPKGYTLQKGDVVVLYATLKYGIEKDDKVLYLTVPGHHGTVNTSLEHVQGLHRHNIEHGSDVLLCNEEGLTYKHIYKVMAIDGDLAWIKTGTESGTVVHMARLLPYVAPVAAPEVQEEPLPAEPLQMPHEMADQDNTAAA